MVRPVFSSTDEGMSSSRMPRMPCSGLKSATSVRFFAAWNASMVDCPPRVRPVWFVRRPILRPASRAKPSACSTSMPVIVRSMVMRPPTAPDGSTCAKSWVSTTGAGATRIAPPDDVRHTGAQGGDVALAVGMHPVRQEHDERLRARIHPQRRAREARVAERARRHQVALVGREGRVDVPAEAADVALALWRRGRGHPGHGQG